MKIFLDIGNTNIAYSYGGDIVHTITSEYFIKNIKEFIDYQIINLAVENIIFSSVVPFISNILIEEVQNRKKSYKEIKIDDIPIAISIQNKNELGIDRAINAYVALEKYQSDCIVIDFGTALTFDIIHKNTYQGGMIFPGLGIAMHSLHTQTAKLPNIKIVEYQFGIGKNTNEAITFGACIGYTGVIKETISFINKHYNYNFKILFTGGSGKMFVNTIQGAVFEENLILQFLQKV